MVDRKDNYETAYSPEYEAIREEVEAEIRTNLSTDDIYLEEELYPLEEEVGLEEVPLDQAVIDTVAVDDTDDSLDTDDDDIDDVANDRENISDLPQEFTESYGTGLQGKPSDRAGRFSRWNDPHLYPNPDAVLTGGDIDANYEQASVVGDESVGGTVSTPDQDVVDELAAAVGVELDDYTDLRLETILEERDDRRWELDPMSSEDYDNRGE